MRWLSQMNWIMVALVVVLLFGFVSEGQAHTVGVEKISAQERNTIAIYKTMSPAVVNITATTIKFDNHFKPYPSQGSGSGFVINGDGYILTNAHVVEGARQVEVMFLEDKSYKAELVGRDLHNDLALLKLDTDETDFPFIALGDSTDLEVGQHVYAIGNPFGLNSTLTTGVISSLNRSIRAPNQRLIEGIIQTDAAINPGNSGGPLLDSSGQLIGINTAIFSPSGASAGIGFAIPVNQAKKVASDLIMYGRVIRPYLGFTVGLRITPRIAQALRLPIDSGLMVGKTYPGSPAEESGIRGGSRRVVIGNRELLLGGDILTAIDEKPIQSGETFINYVESKNPGDMIMLTVYRDGSFVKIPVELKERPENL